MRKNRKKTFEELVSENKQQLLSDKEALQRLEDRWEQRLLKKLD
ncbi:FbpB family small basic protein [Bacillus weihaiensis]|uniref:Fur-regulated basic protein B n=1 Tax=Bacillus weihaiensis TaxID=1547283 RepID=A0A1L3MRZ4_9BACI|nr:FbpB family small basic protein [Bacillus weihaiensis]APH05103.1 Fur-regulated basic protein B [Bacillus weihaiensis]